MKRTSPSLAGLLIACCGLAAPLLALDDSPAQQALRAAAAALDRYETVVAKVRQRSEVFGKQVVGTGTYVQGPVRFNLTRLEFHLQIDDRQSTLLQVCDGKQLWTHRDFWGESKLSCLDAKRVLAAMQKDEALRQRVAVEGLALGGLPRLLRELDRSLRFQELPEASLGGVRVRVLAGEWRPEGLARQMPDQTEKIAAGNPADMTKLPEHIPDQVLVYLGRDDLFSYRIEYRRNTPREPEAFTIFREGPKALVTLELYEVQINTAVDPLQFVYNPGVKKPTDETDVYLKSRGL